MITPKPFSVIVNLRVRKTSVFVKLLLKDKCIHQVQLIRLYVNSPHRHTFTFLKFFFSFVCYQNAQVKIIVLAEDTEIWKLTVKIPFLFHY